MGKKINRVKTVRPGEEPHTLVVTWANRRKSIIDMTGVVWRSERFEALRDLDAFNDVSVITHGWGIGWGSGLDYAAQSLDRLAREQEPMTGEDFAQWQKALALSIQETSDVLGVTVSTIKNYRRKKGALPAVVAIACSALAEDKMSFFAHFRPRHAGRPKAKATG